MTNDEMLLMDAAAAASIEVEYCRIELGGCRTKNGWWNPLVNSGQAFELLVKLKLPLSFGGFQFNKGPLSMCGTYWDVKDSEHYPHIENHGESALAATRRVIVKAAATIMPQVKSYKPTQEEVYELRNQSYKSLRQCQLAPMKCHGDFNKALTYLHYVDKLR